MATITKTFKENDQSSYQSTWTVAVTGTDQTVSGDFTLSLPTVTAKFVYSGKTKGTVRLGLNLSVGGAWAEYDGACWWWLRSPGEPIEYATHVFVDGDIHIYGNRLSISGGVVRPALWLEIYEGNSDTDSESFSSDIPILLETDLNEEIIESPAEPNITEKPEAIPTNEPVHDFAQETMPELRNTVIIHKTTIITVVSLVIIICTLSSIIVFIFRKKKK